jgi:hypothetical protein
MARQGNTDTDMGLENILKEMEKLKDMTVKVGLPVGSGEYDDDNGKKLLIAQVAAWNELGVKNKDDTGWYIPPRPFIRTTADSKREKIQEAIDKNIGLVLHGKADAKTALGGVGEAVVGLIKDTIREGPWDPNSEVTIHGSDSVVVGKETKVSKKTGKTYTKTIKKQFIKGKKSSKPLIDTGTMRNSIQYVTEKNGTEIGRGK